MRSALLAVIEMKVKANSPAEACDWFAETFRAPGVIDWAFFRCGPYQFGPMGHLIGVSGYVAIVQVCFEWQSAMQKPLRWLEDYLEPMRQHDLCSWGIPRFGDYAMQPQTIMVPHAANYVEGDFLTRSSTV